MKQSLELNFVKAKKSKLINYKEDPRFLYIEGVISKDTRNQNKFRFTES
jgi:hypothetical protein